MSLGLPGALLHRLEGDPKLAEPWARIQRAPDQVEVWSQLFAQLERSQGIEVQRSLLFLAEEALGPLAEPFWRALQLRRGREQGLWGSPLPEKVSPHGPFLVSPDRSWILAPDPKGGLAVLERSLRPPRVFERIETEAEVVGLHFGPEGRLSWIEATEHREASFHSFLPGDGVSRPRPLPVARSSRGRRGHLRAAIWNPGRSQVLLWWIESPEPRVFRGGLLGLMDLDPDGAPAELREIPVDSLGAERISAFAQGSRWIVAPAHSLLPEAPRAWLEVDASQGTLLRSWTPPPERAWVSSFFPGPGGRVLARSGARAYLGYGGDGERDSRPVKLLSLGEDPEADVRVLGDLELQDSEDRTPAVRGRWEDYGPYGGGEQFLADSAQPPSRSGYFGWVTCAPDSGTGEDWVGVFEVGRLRRFTATAELPSLELDPRVKSLIPRSSEDWIGVLESGLLAELSPRTGRLLEDPHLSPASILEVKGAPEAPRGLLRDASGGGKLFDLESGQSEDLGLGVEAILGISPKGSRALFLRQHQVVYLREGQLKTPRIGPGSTEFLGEEDLAVVARGQALVLWDFANSQAVHTFTWGPGELRAFGLDRDRYLLFALTGKTPPFIRLWAWDLGRGSLRQEWNLRLPPGTAWVRLQPLEKAEEILVITPEVAVRYALDGSKPRALLPRGPKAWQEIDLGPRGRRLFLRRGQEFEVHERDLGSGFRRTLGGSLPRGSRVFRVGSEWVQVWGNQLMRLEQGPGAISLG